MSTLSAFKQKEEYVLEETRALFRKSLRENNDVTARKFMETDPHARRLVLQLAKKLNMKVKVKDEKGAVNAIRSEALARATTEELFIENRIEIVKEELTDSFRAVERECAERVEERRVVLDKALDAHLALIAADVSVIRAKLDAWRNTQGAVREQILSVCA